MSARPVPLRYSLGRHRFELAFAANERIRVRLCYEQHCPDNDARYILRTTRAWRRPLHVGKYRLVPHGVNIVASNYALEPRPETGRGALGFDREDFWPEQDWQFTWEVGPLKRNSDSTQKWSTGALGARHLYRFTVQRIRDLETNRRRLHLRGMKRTEVRAPNQL